MILRQTVTKLCDSMPAAPVLHTFVQYMITLFSRAEAASDVTSGTFCVLAVPDKCFKLRDSRLYRSPEIRPEAASEAAFRLFFELL